MKRLVSVVVVVAVVTLFAGVALAQGPGMMWKRMGMGPMGVAPMGPGMTGGAPCAAWGAQAAASEPVTEEKARALATEYAATYFKDYTVERVLPFQGRFRTAYQVELKGPKGETRVLHVNPWGQVRPFGPLAAAIGE